MLVPQQDRDVTSHVAVERLEGAMLGLPQVQCPVLHHFGPGIYIREVTLPAGIFAIGHEQRFEQLNIMLRGAVVVIGEDGGLKKLQAPLMYVGPPGRKVGYVLEETVWLNVYATEERDIDKLEEMFLRKSDTWQAYSQELQRLQEAAHLEDRLDFEVLVKAAGFTPEQVRAVSENTEDQVPMPEGVAPKVTIRPSPIEGRGVFLSAPAEEGEVLAPARIGGMRTPVGRYTNHSRSPNARYIKADTGDIYLMATRAIQGCCGGSPGEEVTIDYRQALALSNIHIGEET